MEAPEWIFAYDVKPHWPFGHEVVFEETDKIAWYLSKDDARKLAALLNGAYNLGRSSAYIEFALVRGEPKK